MTKATLESVAAEFQSGNSLSVERAKLSITLSFEKVAMQKVGDLKSSQLSVN